VTLVTITITAVVVATDAMVANGLARMITAQSLTAAVTGGVTRTTVTASITTAMATAISAAVATTTTTTTTTFFGIGGVHDGQVSRQ
jgi:hypothetical protein